MKPIGDVASAKAQLTEVLRADATSAKVSLDLEAYEEGFEQGTSEDALARGVMRAADGLGYRLTKAGVGYVQARRILSAFWDFTGQLLARKHEESGRRTGTPGSAEKSGDQGADTSEIADVASDQNGSREVPKRGGDDPTDLPPPTIHGEEIELADDVLMVWVNAFIPGAAPYSAVVPGSGPYAGKRMIPGPFGTSVWPFTMLPGSDCFLTDNRDFSKLRKASSRMHSLAVFDLSTTPVRWDQHHRCDLSVEVDCEDGDLEDTAYPDPNDMKYSDFVGDQRHFTVKLDASAFDPLFGFPASIFVPYIDISLSFTWVGMLNMLLCSGTVDDYPAFECYAQRGTGPVQALFLRPAPRGGHPTDLYGGPTAGGGHSPADVFDSGNSVSGVVFL